MNAVAFIANAQDHHPDLSVHYNRCVVRFNTHDVGGISVTDFDCAAQVDALLRLSPRPRLGCSRGALHADWSSPAMAAIAWWKRPTASA